MAFRSTAVRHNIRKWAYNLSGFNKYGLHHDDVLYENDDVKEALRRLPARVRDDRHFRLLRAIQCSIQHVYLPKDQWTKWEEDNKYLSPILEVVKKERLEREAWEKNY